MNNPRVDALLQSFAAWRIVEELRGVGVMPPDAKPGGLVIRTTEELLPAILADKAFHRYVKYVIIADESRRPQLRVPVPRDYNGHPYLSGGRGEILAGGMIHVGNRRLQFTNETTHFRTGEAQEAILNLLLGRMNVEYSVAFPRKGRSPDLFVEVDTDF